MRNLSAAEKGLNTAIEQMTTGKKLIRAKDNAANYSIMKNIVLILVIKIQQHQLMI